jgi:Fur family zinc uptake transcriptional regulator
MPTRASPRSQTTAATAAASDASIAGISSSQESPLAEAALRQRLTEAETLCRQRGTQLTALRREVLELLLLRNGTAKAYDLQDDMRARHGRVAPTTVYRALDFLMDQGLVHRVDTVNSFVACNSDHAGHHPGHHTLMVVCARCAAVSELHDHDAMAVIAQRLRSGVPGFMQTGVEIKGICAPCLRQGDPAQPAVDHPPGPHEHSDHPGHGSLPR